MYWVVQSNLYNEKGYFELVTALERMGIRYSVVKTAPIVDKLIPGDFDTHAFKGEAADMPDAEIDDSGLVMVCGTHTLARIAHTKGWKPGSFLNDNFDFAKWREQYGELLLNADATTGKLGTVTPEWDAFFIRPCGDEKAFSGEVVTKEGFGEWRAGILKLGSDIWNIGANTDVMMSTVKEIYAEYRFFVIDGDLVTASRYKMGSRVIYSPDVSDEARNMAKRAVELWQPARAFVIDVADTPKGPKIVEINNINSAGFYACNMGKVVEAIENMTF